MNGPRRVHLAPRVSADAADAIEQALADFAVSGRAACLEAPLCDAWNRLQAARWSTTCRPTVEAWETLDARLRPLGLALGSRREVARAPWGRLPEIADRHTRLIDLKAPQILIDKDVELLAGAIRSLDARGWTPVDRFATLDRVHASSGPAVLDLGEYAAMAFTLLTGPFPDDQGTGDLGEDARFTVLDDYWHIHRQVDFDRDVDARSLGPDALVPPDAPLGRPFLLLPEDSRQPDIVRWRARGPALPMGEHGGTIWRVDAADHTRLSAVWIRSEERTDPWRW